MVAGAGRAPIVEHSHQPALREIL
ncbi:MAG: hypothetical protein JWO25_3922, partial [Alphaproteobacteria bacterium]|nr:hypothetical protein [Alphaproteobacteria bacterium]